MLELKGKFGVRDDWTGYSPEFVFLTRDQAQSWIGDREGGWYVFEYQ